MSAMCSLIRRTRRDSPLPCLVHLQSVAGCGSGDLGTRMRHLLFVYGTLRDPDLFRLVVGRPLAVFRPRPFRLAGWRAAKPARAPFPVLTQAPQSHAAGLILAPMDAGSLARLIRYEGPGYALRPLKRLSSHDLLHAFLPLGAPEAHADDWRLEEWTALHKAETLSAIRRNPLLRAARKP